ncbi:GPW/gp25 family protein [Silvimonas sp.]|uniref:GPW/gp25 family protein n=1 Tax=Silvimonas sp. TaxID=2650811 RepID=UPI00283B9A27|nr:GPW/gp25 family protein [Silvimonas sp.]MDR3429019.1 GPW/gp25 family protein [Silvimonas sp.]
MSWGMNAATGRALTDLDHIRQSVQRILATPLGTRLARRTFGAMAAEQIDLPLHAVTLQKTRAAAVMALRRWEPRLRLTRVDFIIGDKPGSAFADLTAERVDGSRIESVRLTVPVRGGTA